MITLSWVILFFSLFVSCTITICSAYLSDTVKEFRFKKADNEYEEFNFSSLEADNDETYCGKTLKVSDFYFIRDKDDTLYWTQFRYDELEALEKNEAIIKSVRIVEQGDDELRFGDYFSNYKINITEGFLYNFLYDTEWNLENICFTKVSAENDTFEFKILSDNNSREYNGTTCIENADLPYVQRINLYDGSRIEIYEIEFTKDELQANDPFCRGISKIISQERLPHGYTPNQEIDPNALKSLIG